jgi:hypothetical protein
VGQIVRREGEAGLRTLEGIGDALARSIEELLSTGRLPLLERLRGESDPVKLLASVPGIGEKLAERLHEALDISTLEELETAAHDGRLEALPGFGPKRVAGIRDSLGGRLGRRRRSAKEGSGALPSVDELLDVDAEYRSKAEKGRLRTIAPKRFNPEQESWLPVLHTQRGDRSYTALFSNTARAHELGMTRDWVVLYFEDGRGERQSTVVTARSGRLKGKRVVRGREEECRKYYERHARPVARTRGGG